MTPTRTVLILIIIFVWLSVLLNLFRIITFNYSEIISYSFIFLGISIYYPSYLRRIGKGVFWGSAIFFAGIVFFIDSYFELKNGFGFIIPAFLFICSFSILLTFLVDTGKIKLLALSLILAGLAVFSLYYTGTPKFNSFLLALNILAGKLWIVVLLTVITIVILRLEKKADR